MNITNEDWIEYRKNATKYLEQHSQYATRKAVQIAIDKQISQNIVATPYFYGKLYYCPSCGYYIGGDHNSLKHIFYCENCGQKIEINTD